MSIIYQGQSYRFMVARNVRVRLNTIVYNNICYGVFNGSVDDARSRNLRLQNIIKDVRTNPSYYNRVYATLPSGTLVFRIEIDSVPVGDRRVATGVPNNLRYYLFVLFNGKYFRASKMFGVMENWKDGYLKNRLKAVINENVCKYSVLNYIKYCNESHKRVSLSFRRSCRIAGYISECKRICHTLLH